jgi:hypothetical protein
MKAFIKLIKGELNPANRVANAAAKSAASAASSSVIASAASAGASTGESVARLHLFATCNSGSVSKRCLFYLYLCTASWWPWQESVLCLVCLGGTDGFCPFRDKTVLSFWPVILILLNLPDCLRYDPSNIIIMYIATSATQGQPTNFLTHAGILAQELRDAADGFDLEVGGDTLRVHVVVPMWALDGRGARAGTHAVAFHAFNYVRGVAREKFLNRASSGARAGCADCEVEATL